MTERECRSLELRNSLTPMINNMIEIEFTYLIGKGYFKEDFSRGYIHEVFHPIQVVIFDFIKRYSDQLTESDEYNLKNDVIEQLDWVKSTIRIVFKEIK